MKGIIYTTLTEAQAALQACTNIDQGTVEFIGEKDYAPIVEPTPYTYILPHPDGTKWALIADSKVETAVSKTATKLLSNWFPKIEY